MGSSRVVGAVSVWLVLGVGFAACAKGNELGTGGGSLGGGTTVTTTGTGGAEAGPMSTIGQPCVEDACAQGTCTLIGTTKYCTQPCPPVCPNGTYCSIIGGNPICVPDLGQQCAKCAAATDCKLPSDACLTAPLGDQFCARDCSVDGFCPNGYVCQGGSGSLDGGAGDGGAKDAGSGKDAGGSADAGDGGDGGDAGEPLPANPDKWCVPDDGASCPCGSGRDGVSRTCDVTNAAGTCAGMETCDGTTSAWMGCNAATPVAETCNGKDDNCNGKIDEGDPNLLCASMGAPPPNSTWACSGGACQLGACNAGYVSYPPGPPSAGCPCKVDPGEPNDTCAKATNAGSVQDLGGAPLVITGTLSSAADVDVYTFNTVDTDEVTTNSYHVAINFTQPASNGEFVMDVLRGDPCSDAPTGGFVNITSYDWCVNAAGATNGEAPCGPTDAHHCTDQSSVYYVRVHRVAGAIGSCTQYQLTVTGGGGTCDLTQTCN